MITSEDRNATIKDPDMLNWLSENEIRKIKVEEQSSKLKLTVPKKFIETKKDNTIYKVGFLRTFLKKLYPKDSYQKIVGIMNDRYQIFLGKRQIERYAIEYRNNKKYH
jgi:hypothetical protein